MSFRDIDPTLSASVMIDDCSLAMPAGQKHALNRRRTHKRTTSNIEAAYCKAKQMHFNPAVLADIELEMNRNVLLERRPRSMITARKLFPQEDQNECRRRAHSHPAMQLSLA